MTQCVWHHDGDYFLAVNDRSIILFGFGDAEDHIEWHYSIDWREDDEPAEEFVKYADTVVEVLNRLMPNGKE